MKQQGKKKSTKAKTNADRAAVVVTSQEQLSQPRSNQLQAASAPPNTTCHICNKIFASEINLNRHSNKFHPTLRNADELVPLPCYIDKIKKMKSTHPSNLMILHINICSIRTKIQFIDEILLTKNVDVLFISETFLDEDTSVSFYKNVNYNLSLRRDRGKHGGGFLVYVRKGYTVREAEKSLDYESIAFTLTANDNNYNFISSYKPPSDPNDKFICHLESLMFNFDPLEPLVIVGDLNMDLLSSAGDELKDFMVNNELKSGVDSPTRIQTNFYKKDNTYKTSSTLIDVILHNQDLVAQTMVIECPF
jgi:hypothetical protein